MNREFVKSKLIEIGKYNFERYETEKGTFYPALGLTINFPFVYHYNEEYVFSQEEIEEIILEGVFSRNQIHPEKYGF